MKRSDALKIIDDQYITFVTDWLELDITNEEQLKCFIPLNERILKCLETQGMLPPFTYLKKVGKLDTAWEPEE